MRNKTIYYETESFHIGSDKIIHFTETHLKKKYTDYCVDITIDIVPDPLDTSHRLTEGDEFTYDPDDPKYTYNPESYDENDGDVHNDFVYDDYGTD